MRTPTDETEERQGVCSCEFDRCNCEKKIYPQSISEYRRLKIQLKGKKEYEIINPSQTGGKNMTTLTLKRVIEDHQKDVVKHKTTSLIRPLGIIWRKIYPLSEDEEIIAALTELKSSYPEDVELISACNIYLPRE